MKKILLKALYGVPVAVFVAVVIMLILSIQNGQIITVVPELISGDATMSLTDLEGTIKLFVLVCIIGYVWAFAIMMAKKVQDSKSTDFAKFVITMLLFLLIINTFLILTIPKTLKGIIFIVISNIVEIVVFAVPIWFIAKVIYKKEVQKINEKIKEK